MIDLGTKYYAEKEHNVT